MNDVFKDRKSTLEKMFVIGMTNQEALKLKTCLNIFVASTFLFLIPLSAYSEEPSISFQFGEYNPFFRPTIITVTDDSANIDEFLPDIITVGVTSTSDPVGITLDLIETGASTGIFQNTDLIFMDGDYFFSLDDSISVVLNCAEFNFDSNTIEILENPMIVLSSSDEDGIVFFLTETQKDSGIFEGQFSFNSESTNQELFSLLANPGDVISALYPCDPKQISIGQMLPNSDSTIGAILAPVDDTVTVIYGEISDTVFVRNTNGGGSSSGGLVINRIVLDVLAGGTSGGDFAPPLLTIPKLNLSNLPLVGDILNFIQNVDPFTPITPLNDSSIDYPVSINGNGYLLTQFANTIQTYHGKTGEPVSFKMNLSDATGVEHIALYTNLRGDHREIQDSDTFLTYNEGKPLEITDPHGFFSNVNFTESEYNGKYIAEFNMTFVKPMDASDVIIRTWDELRNSGDIKIFDAIKIEGESIKNPDTNNLIILDSAEIFIPYYKLPYYEIPKADSKGNLVYHNSFGGLEEKQVQPYHVPAVYPDHVGRDERHDNGFYDSVIFEETRAKVLAEKLIDNPFVSSEDKTRKEEFNYPSNVGKLDREDKDFLKIMKEKEYSKAINLLAKKH